MLHLSPLHLGWCAGLYEGEGSTSCSPRRPAIKARLTLTDRDVLERFVERSGVGSIMGPYEPKGISRKLQYVWQAQGSAAVAFLQAIYPLLGSRRQAQIDEAMRRHESRPQHRIKPEDWSAIWARRDAGETYQAIANDYGVILQRIWWICNREREAA